MSLHRTLIIEMDPGCHEAAWNMVCDSLADAEGNGELAAAVLDTLHLPDVLADHVVVRIA